MTLDATISGAGSNSYVTLAYANQFFERLLLPNAWDSAVPDDQERALMTATQWLEEFDYIGSLATTTQALAWPRFGMLDDTHNPTLIPGRSNPTLILGKYDETEMPVPLMNAQCELAFYLLTLGPAAGSAITTGLGTISSLKLGNEVETRYQVGGSSATAVVAPLTDASGLPIHVARLLSGLRQPVVIA